MPLFRKATNKRAAAVACISSFLTSNTSMCFFLWLVKFVALLRRSRLDKRFRRHVIPRTQFIGSSYGDLVSLAQAAEYLDRLSVLFSGLHVHPFGVSVANADHERRLRRPRDGGSRHEERRLRPPHRPQHFRKHAGTQTPVRIVDV